MMAAGMPIEDCVATSSGYPPRLFGAGRGILHLYHPAPGAITEEAEIIQFDNPHGDPAA